jgi:mannosyl-3-phosphoglycerate phosphatase
LIDKKSSSHNKLLVFSDLDGTLLDRTTYSFEPALPAIQVLEKNGIPLVFCTSKTRAEIEHIRTKLNNTHPFISENGGAIYIPKGYFVQKGDHSRKDELYHTIELGTPYVEIRETLERIQAESGIRMRGFGDLSDKEVALFCDFSEEDARRAKQREYDEPFFLEDRNQIQKVKQLAAQANLQITEGGRFFHLMGNNDKGKAVRHLIKLYAPGTESGSLTTIGIGDSTNDLPMLESVDHPLLLQKSEGRYEEGIDLENLTHAPGLGPGGWRNAILKLLDNLGTNITTANRF